MLLSAIEIFLELSGWYLGLLLTLFSNSLSNCTIERLCLAVISFIAFLNFFSNLKIRRISVYLLNRFCLTNSLLLINLVVELLSESVHLYFLTSHHFLHHLGDFYFAQFCELLLFVDLHLIVLRLQLVGL